MSAPSSIRLPGLWVVIAGVHVAAAGAAWHLLPGGFGVGERRFWMNEAVPVVLVAAAATCWFGLWRQRAPLAAFAIALFAGVPIAMAPSWLVVFPLTGTLPAEIAGVIAVVVGACAVASVRRARSWPVVAGAVVGLVIGAFVPWSQRGAEARTHPAGGAQELAPAVAGSSLPGWVHAYPDSATVALDTGSVRVALRPLLTFHSRSPDRGWTLFAPRRVPTRHLTTTSATSYEYAGDEPATLSLSSPSEDVLHVDAETRLPNAVYSHLNTFSELEIAGHHHLFLAFSPCPTARIEVTFSEYPVGRPERFAYLDAAHELHVVEAASGEKGPFTELAHGPLPADGALAITLFDDQTPLAEIALADFASQASTQMSPTGGWGVPENAIEFSLAAARPDSAAAIFITLAGTSVGRGWDSVGHAPGIYRNRIDVRRLRMPP